MSTTEEAFDSNESVVGVLASLQKGPALETTPSVEEEIAEVTGHLAEQQEELVIEPKRGWIPIDFRELWRYRELLFFLVWRDVKVRYKQTVLGIAWAVLVPIFSVTVFTVIFGNFANLKETLPAHLVNAYPVYVYAGLLPWLFFSNAISMGGMSLVSQQQLLTKIYFPRLFVPTATVSGSLVDMGLSFGVFCALMAIYGVVPAPTILLLPLLVLMVWSASLGIAYTLSALTVSYRDFRFVVPFMVQGWQFLSPVVYPTTIVPERYRLIYALNPLAGIIEGFRSCIFGTEVPWQMIGVSAVSTAALLVFGMFYFRKTERRFADIA
ncbi:ABC transporter permease [Aeoliella sp. ICT_H6.2]|uniref:Transport permease protein n=1 Tax=Aeoliella straminimaris TaxID=2954799 RepID=A0A9X2FBA4_9BACT|nr:ABC transporter permease [Aeoliella straminimaris]MCO6045369.1 ABC transporter permease [Aeoliella straminimaris]